MVMAGRTLLFLFCMIAAVAFADNAPLVVELNKTTLFENRPIEGTVVIEHDVKDVIDVKSFTMDGKPLPVVFVKDAGTTPGSPIIRSTYRFQIDAQKEGLHILPSISVRSISGTFISPSIAYEVIGGNAGGSDDRQVILQLEAVADHPDPFYLGQTARFGYRMVFNDNIELKDQQLPLLEAEGFRKIGDQQVSDRRDTDKAIHQVIQVVKPINQGTFTFGSAYITGMAYREVSGGQRTYTTGELRADAPGVTVVVKAFPEEGKPASFNGAVGEDLDFRVFLLTLPEVTMGDQMLLSLNVSGKGDLADMPLPDLCCQPGFPGVFKQSDLPPVDEVRGPARSYVVEMRALTDKVTQIPSIEFSYYNPKTSKYVVVKSNPIPIVVNPAPGNINVPPSTAAEKIEQRVNAQEQQGAVWPNASTAPPSIEIKTIYALGTSDLRNLYFGTWWVFLLVPLGMFVLYGQMLVIQQREKEKSVPKVKDSLDFFEEAIQEKDNPAKFYNSLNYAFMLRLVECGWIPKTNIGPEQLPQVDICGEVREFLMRIEAGRFAGQGALTSDQIVEQARSLFERIHHHG